METVKGFKDFLGEDAIKRQKIREILVKSFNLYGFEPAETPIVEYEEFVRGDNPSDEAVSDTFKLKDRGNRKLALRYEFTFQLKRLAKNQKLPFKRYQMGNVFRDEPISGNRFRQFMQCDVDIIGSSIKDEAEVLTLTFNVLKELGISADMARSKSVAEFLQRDDLDLVITVCDHAKENCPVFPKPIPQIHIGIDDPALYSDKPDDIVISIFRQTVNLINEKIILYLSESKNLFGDKK